MSSQKEIKYGICLQAYIPVRNEPYERAEMVTQILFGETIEILDEEGKWLYVKSLFDSYEGWVDKKCIDQSEGQNEVSHLIIKNSVRIKNLSSGLTVVTAIGCSTPRPEGNRFQLANNLFEIDDPSNLIAPGNLKSLETAINEVIAIPYLWGGRSGFGFDCSGLVQYLCRVAGTSLPRDASEQSAEGNTLSFLNEVKLGDLAFFDDTEGMIHHVGMLLGDSKILHASGTVRIDSIDQQGIFNKKLGVYTHKLRVMKRVLK